MDEWLRHYICTNCGERIGRTYYRPVERFSGTDKSSVGVRKLSIVCCRYKIMLGADSVRGVFVGLLNKKILKTYVSEKGIRNRCWSLDMLRGLNWVWLEFDCLWYQVGKTYKGLKGVWIDLVELPWATEGSLTVLRKLGWSVGEERVYGYGSDGTNVSWDKPILNRWRSDVSESNHLEGKMQSGPSLDEYESLEI
ncbi:hypothetical protein Tco_1371422 [Tanacetum coccineum]